MNGSKDNSSKFISQNSSIKKILEDIKKVADFETPILIIGETGTGKELLADYIYENSVSRNKPFYKIGLAALPPDLLESELFGHTKGAFTSAVSEKKGIFELSNSGIIFLDDIDDFPLRLQAKLLRVIENKEMMKIGAEKPIKLDIKIIAATKVDLAEMVKKGLFRADLYYRLNGIPLRIPPLRKRKEDIILLTDHFFKVFHPDSEIKICDSVREALIKYSWPGNVRELKNIIHRICLFATDNITINDIPPEISSNNNSNLNIKECMSCFNEGGYDVPTILRCVEYNLINQALKVSKGNKNSAAKSLKMKPTTFRDKLKKYSLGNPSTMREPDTWD